MNQIIMEKTMDEAEKGEVSDMVPANLHLPKKPPRKEVPYLGMVPIAKHDFPEAFSNFCFNSLFIKDEVIKAMVQIREECNNVHKDNRIFNVVLNGKVMRVEEFKQHQTSSITSIRFATRESGWVSKLEKICKTSFQDVGKGWFNIHEMSKETYEFGKLKKFLTLINFMMHDTVLNITKDSVKDFVEFMLNFIPDETEIISSSHVKNTFPKKAIKDEETEETDAEEEPEELEGIKDTRKWLNGLFRKDKDPDPLFILDLILKPGQLVPMYSTNPNDVVDKIKEVFENGISVM